MHAVCASLPTVSSNRSKSLPLSYIICCPCPAWAGASALAVVSLLTYGYCVCAAGRWLLQSQLQVASQPSQSPNASSVATTLKRHYLTVSSRNSTEVVLSGTGTPSVASAPVSPNRSTIAMTAERISVSALLGPAPSAEQRQKLLLTIRGECCCWRTDAAKLGQSRQRCAYAGDMLNATALPPQLQLRLASFTCRITCCTGNVQGWGSSALDA